MIRPAKPADREAVLDIHRKAFGSEGEAGLVAALLDDPSAAPRVSILAEVDGRAVAHVLFTRVTISGAAPPQRAAILCPLAVHPAHQSRGLGTEVTRAGLDALRAAGCDLAFVLGDPGYYSRFGFLPAVGRGLTPPYELADAYADAWRVLFLSGGDDSPFKGEIRCADSLMDERFWRE